MTIELEMSASAKGPRYRAIAAMIASHIASGEYGPGTRLPTHRELASSLGVTVGTVSRAYAELERRGLVRGEVGRGTFVLGGAADDMPVPEEQSGEFPIDLGRNYPASTVHRSDLMGVLADVAGDPGLVRLLGYQPHAGRSEHRVAGASWVRRGGLDVPEDRVILTAGAQHGILVALSTLLSPGDRVGVEALSFPGTKAVARMLGCRLEPLEMDSEGIVPEAAEAACRDGVRVICCVPGLHNPTNALMSVERRRHIAEIVAAHDAYVIEDDIFGLLLPEPLPPISTFAQRNGLYITSLSKTVAPGLRVGYLVVPPALFEKACATMRATCWMAPPIMAEVTSRWIDDGTALSILERTRKEAAARMKLARRILGPWSADAPDGAMHVWFQLPDAWTSDRLVAAARERGVLLTSAAPFMVGTTEAPRAVRICLGTPPTRKLLEEALERLAGILEAGLDSGADLSIV
jgi:DNA-binding transcriptional MocR family regulator